MRYPARFAPPPTDAGPMPATLESPPRPPSSAAASSPPAPVPDVKLTETDYLHRERTAADGPRHEFADGEMIAMPGASFRHTRLAGQILAALLNLVGDRPLAVTSADLRIRVPNGRHRYPDVLICPDPPAMLDDEQDTVTDPLVIVEILSPTTAVVDRGDKLDDYRSIPSLTDYLIVSQDEPTVDHYTRLSETEWKLVTYSGPDAVVPVTDVGDLTLGPLYPAS